MPHAQALQPSSTTPVAGLREKGCPRPAGYGSRRRRASRRSAGCGTLLFLAMMLASTGALPFKSPFKRWGKRKGGKGGKVGQQQQQSGSSRRSTGKRDKVKEDVAWLLEDASDGGWKPVRDDGHVKVWKRSIPGSDFVAIKSSATLNVSSQALFEVLTPGDIEIVQQYNALVENGRDLEVMDRDNKVSWSATMAIWPCRPRDFVTHIRRATLADGSVAIVNSATTHPKAPVSSRYVRGEISRGVFHIKAARNKKQSDLTMVHHFNPGGNVPAWLMNWLAEGKPLTFVRQLEEVAAKWDEQANSSRSMPCKGRGFADKPCQFLLSSKDDGGKPEAGYLGRSGGGWVALAAVLVTTALALYGRNICRDSPLDGAEKEEPSPSPAVNGQQPKEKVIGQKQEQDIAIGEKRKEENGSHEEENGSHEEENGSHEEENGSHALVGGGSIESVSEGSVEHAVSGVSVDNVPEAPFGRVSTGRVGVERVAIQGVGEGETVHGEITAGDAADGVVNGDLSSVEANDVKISCQEATVENSPGGQEVSTDKPVVDSEDTPTGEVMTSDVSSEEVRDGEGLGLHGVEEGRVASDDIRTDGKMDEELLLERHPTIGVSLFGLSTVSARSGRLSYSSE